MGVEGELVRKARFAKKSGNTFLMMKIFVSKDSHQDDSFFFLPYFRRIFSDALDRETCSVTQKR